MHFSARAPTPNPHRLAATLVRIEGCGMETLMNISIAFAIAVICAAMMGYAIQSGATCTVYAISELIQKRRANRLIAMLEAGLWVAVMLMIAGLVAQSPLGATPYGVSHYTVLGGALLGLGAYVNGACVFGSVARLGSGEYVFLLTPFGYFAGVKLFDLAFKVEPAALPDMGSAPHLPTIVLSAMALYALARLARVLWWTAVRDRPHGAPTLWDPHEATLVIGITFAVMLLGVGHWTYPELLSDLAKGKLDDTAWRIALFAALLLGSRLGGFRHGMVGWIKPTSTRIKTCLIGGAMMGVGGALVPGGNDGLVLVGLPFLMPYALVALATMVAVIALAIWSQRFLPKSTA